MSMFNHHFFPIFFSLFLSHTGKCCIFNSPFFALIVFSILMGKIVTWVEYFELMEWSNNTYFSKKNLLFFFLMNWKFFLLPIFDGIRCLMLNREKLNQKKKWFFSFPFSEHLAKLIEEGEVRRMRSNQK